MADFSHAQPSRCEDRHGFNRSADREPVRSVAAARGRSSTRLKTALACCLATGLSYFFRLPSGQLAAVFAYLLLTMGMPSPRLNWLLTQLAIAISAIGVGLDPTRVPRRSCSSTWR